MSMGEELKKLIAGSRWQEASAKLNELSDEEKKVALSALYSYDKKHLKEVPNGKTTLLHLMVMHHAPYELFTQFFDAGADPLVKDSSSKTPLDFLNENNENNKNAFLIKEFEKNKKDKEKKSIIGKVERYIQKREKGPKHLWRLTNRWSKLKIKTPIGKFTKDQKLDAANAFKDYLKNNNFPDNKHCAALLNGRLKRIVKSTLKAVYGKEGAQDVFNNIKIQAGQHKDAQNLKKELDKNPATKTPSRGVGKGR